MLQNLVVMLMEKGVYKENLSLEESKWYHKIEFKAKVIFKYSFPVFKLFETQITFVTGKTLFVVSGRLHVVFSDVLQIVVTMFINTPYIHSKIQYKT